MYFRAVIREGDTVTPGGGFVRPRREQSQVSYFDKIACFEGDPVFCNTCQSWGVTKCVPPYRPNTGPSGRQANLDGDLCICQCPVPPRLKASIDFVRMGFEASEIGSDAIPCFIAAGHDPTILGLSSSQRFLLTDANTGAALAGVPYMLECGGLQVEGLTDVDGMTQEIFARADGAVVAVHIKVDAA